MKQFCIILLCIIMAAPLWAEESLEQQRADFRLELQTLKNQLGIQQLVKENFELKIQILQDRLQDQNKAISDTKIKIKELQAKIKETTTLPEKPKE